MVMAVKSNQDELNRKTVKGIYLKYVLAKSARMLTLKTASDNPLNQRQVQNSFHQPNKSVIFLHNVSNSRERHLLKAFCFIKAACTLCMRHPVTSHYIQLLTF